MCNQYICGTNIDGLKITLLIDLGVKFNCMYQEGGAKANNTHQVLVNMFF